MTKRVASTAARSEGRSDTAVRRAALAGVAAPILCGVVFIIAAQLRPGYSSIREYGSALAEGPHAWLQTGNFIVVGLLEMVFAVGLQRGITAGRGSKLGPALVFIYGLGWVLVGVFHGRVHQLATYLFVALPAACIVISPRLARDRYWKGYVPITLLAGIVALILAAGWYVHHIQMRIPHIESWIGLYQRMFYAEMFCWLEVLALGLLILSHRRAPSQRFSRPPTVLLFEEVEHDATQAAGRS